MARFLSVAGEMFATLVRAACSPNIRERRDCSAGVFDADGNLVALSAIGPIHLGSLMGLVEKLTVEFPRDALAPGDCFMTNDPYVGGGSHLPDITLVSPVCHDGGLAAVVANLAHHSDIGGRVPGSESADRTSIYQEGLRIPVVRIARDGALVRDDCRLSGRGLRFHEGARGEIGGRPGSVGRFLLHPDTERERSLDAAFSELTLARGDVIGLETADGGGYGPPHARRPDRVFCDVLEGRVSARAARTEYGVEIDGGSIDEVATAVLRTDRVR